MATQNPRAGEFILSEGNGHISRETITIASGEGVLNPGQILGKITASGKYAAYDNAAADGTEVADAILYNAVDATSADVEAVAVIRLAEVKELSLTGLDTASIADLDLKTIIVR